MESVQLSLLGGAGGKLIALWGVHLFDLATQNVGKPYWIVFRMDSRSRYLSGFLVVSEVALSLVLLVGAGLMIRSFMNAYTSGALVTHLPISGAFNWKFEIEGQPPASGPTCL